MNIITVDRYVDRRGYFWQKTDVSCEEQGAQGETGEKGEPGVGISNAEIQNGNLVFGLSNGQTTTIGKMPYKTLKSLNLGSIDGENKTFIIAGYEPMNLLINGVTYGNSEYTTNGYSLTTTFADNVPTGEVYLFYKEVQ